METNDKNPTNWKAIYRVTVILLLMWICLFLFWQICISAEIYKNTTETNDLLKGIWDILQENQDLYKDSP